ncbi:hypothetical protein KP509_29G024300 [Ceratopteris richardii]|uniref:Ferredoxin thioredoxin reductase alpha chain domain-containing protein n=1 Tax=Ceratopteris richardii TaxID=49495 RepID=A0A8T2R6H9_CERRI|nr:hypothetical protein KP509_29G024300 [Ceratopteris richardii]
MPSVAPLTGSSLAAASSSSSRALCASSPQTWRSQLSFLHRLSRSRPHRLAIVCETAVDVNGLLSTGGTQGVSPSIGSRIRVCKPLQVYHVPKQPKFELEGCEGELKDILKIYKGKPISANLPFKVQFVLDLDGKQVKFFAHLKEDEFEVI